MLESVLDIFREEAREHLMALEKGFLDLDAAQELAARRNVIDNLFRHAHSLKGDAKVVGLDALRSETQVLEDFLDELRRNPEHVDQSRITAGLAQLDTVREAFETWRESTASASTKSALSDDLPRAALPSPAASHEPVAATEAPSPQELDAPQSKRQDLSAAASPFATEELFTVRVTSAQLDRMLSLAGELRVSRRSSTVLFQGMAALTEHLVAAARASGKCNDSRDQQSVDAALDQLHRIESERHQRQLRQDLLLEALEGQVRQARLLPLQMLADAMRRIIRDLSHSLDKPLRYEVNVGQVLLDKAVIESLKDPLQHLIRNAADHGIEGKEARAVAGKTPEGTIRIDATQHGASVRIAISDDGQGLNYERIRERLRRFERLSEAELEQLSDAELHTHLFRPGFTTASAGDISGRGVGLDVVQDSVRRLHGSVRIESTPGAGTTFFVTVPVSISTVRVVTVDAGGQTYGIPTSSIIRVGYASRSDLRPLQGGLVLSSGDHPIPWVHLADFWGNAAGFHSVSGKGAMPYLLIANGTRQIAVAVDELQEESEVLLKQLGFPLAGMNGVLGATIRTDGSVQLVIDISGGDWMPAHSAVRPAQAEVQRAKRIMVVDDSPTTRAVLRNVFAAAGFSVTTATDGIDAMERLRSQRVDVVVSDIEMPRLNGFDLTRQIKARFGLPVILVTGREQEEHRLEGMEAGADAFVIKSTFEGQGLLEIVEQYT